MKLSVNTGFLVNRYPDPNQWSEIIKEIKIKNIQITADLFNPYYPDQVLEDQVKNINKLSEKYNFREWLQTDSKKIFYQIWWIN